MKQIQLKALRLFFLLLLTNTIGYVGSGFMTVDAMNWYHTLNKSPLTPPGIVFSAVWTGLFVLMAISAFLTWKKVSPRWFVLQLCANLAWTFVFFYLREIGVAALCILALLFCVFKTITGFYKVSVPAAYLMIPTFVWGIFALYLNIYIVMYN
ncbi:MAG: TspO/MBR family protein [Alphaproteobacteria bacterium]